MPRVSGFRIFRLVWTGAIFLLGVSLVGATVPQPSPGNQATAILVQKLLQDHHFAGKPLTEEKARDWVRAYMEALDYNHAFFLESDLKTYQDGYGPLIAKLTQRGDITPAYEIFSGFNDRVRERLDWIKRRLTMPFDFTSEQTYEIDRTRVGWPADRAAADELWERRLKFDLLREKLVAQSPAERGKAEKKKEEDPLTTVTKRYDRLLKNLEDYDNEEISQLYLTALASLYDPHSSYMSPSTLEDFSIGIKLALVGIGAVLSSEDGYCVIKELVPGGPADLDGRLKVGDKIVGVAQGEGHFEDIVDMKLRNAVKKIRGPKNTVVRLQVIPAGSAAGELREIQITRDEVKLSAQQASATIYDLPKSGSNEPVVVQSIQPEATAPAGSLWDNLKSRLKGKSEARGEMVPAEIPAKKSEAWRIGLIDLPSFYGEVGGADSAASGNGATPRSTSQDVEILIQQLNRAGVDGIILDLRKNGGGLLDEAVALTGLFIDQGPVVQVRDGKGTVIQRTDDNAGVLYRGPLLVMVGRRSASASEIVAGALQNYRRAIIVGEKSTHGKGTVQAVVELGKFLQRPDQTQPKAGAMKLTIQKFYLPNGHSTQNRGVIPDISIPSPLDYMKIGESDLPNPLPWDEINPARFEPLALDPTLRALLNDKSKERLSSDPDVAFLQKDIEKVRARLEAGTISLNETRRLDEKKTEDLRNDERKKIEERIQQILDPTIHLVIDAKKDSAVATEKNPKKKKMTLEESADGESEGVTDAIDLAETLELREGLRIMTDWLVLSAPGQSATVAKDRDTAKTTSVK
jgi:carboxyl-terminal processing protease